MTVTSKPMEARQIEARSRSKVLRVRVTEIERGHAYSTISQSGKGVYTIARTRTGWTCECDGFLFTGCCKHIAAVERRSEREGWLFGRIATQPSNVPDRALGMSLLMGKAR